MIDESHPGMFRMPDLYETSAYHQDAVVLAAAREKWLRLMTTHGNMAHKSFVRHNIILQCVLV